MNDRARDVFDALAGRWEDEERGYSWDLRREYFLYHRREESETPVKQILKSCIAIV